MIVVACFLLCCKKDFILRTYETLRRAPDFSVRGRVGLFARCFPSSLNVCFTKLVAYRHLKTRVKLPMRCTQECSLPSRCDTNGCRWTPVVLSCSNPSWKLNGKSSHPASTRSPICLTPQLDARSFEGSPLCGAEDHNDSPEQKRPQGTHLLSGLQGYVYSTVAHYAGTADSIFSDSPPT
jgi:hypothetical protein